MKGGIYVGEGKEGVVRMGLVGWTEAAFIVGLQRPGVKLRSRKN